MTSLSGATCEHHTGAMPVMQTLRRLDDRVIGKQKKPNREQARQACLVGVGGWAVVLLLAATFRKPLILSGVGGFVGVTLGGLVRWRNASRPEERPTLRLLTAVAVLMLALTFGGYVAMFRAADDTDLPVGPTVDPYRNMATMVVLCARTDKGDAYTYQAPATEVPTCRNGAVPKVVVRG